MVIEYYNGHLPIHKIRDLLKISQQGTTAYHIVEGAKKIGFDAKGVKCDVDDINEDNIILPCIANVVINNSYKHFIVIYKIDFIKNTILIADPSNKLMTMSFDIFKTIFSGVLILLYPKDEIPCEKSINQKIKLLTYIVKTHPKLIKQIGILSLFITLFSISSSFFLESISSSITKYNSSDILILVIFLFATITFLKCLTNYFREKVLLIKNEKINLRFTLDTLKKVLSLPYKIYCNKTTGDMITHVMDVSVIRDSCCKIFLTLLVDLPLTFLAVFVLILINSKLFLLSVIVLSFNIIIILGFKDYFKESVDKIKKSNILVTNHMVESICNYETLKGINVSEPIFEQFEKKFVSLLKDSYNYESVICLQKFLKCFVSEAGLILIYGIGALLVINDKISFSSLLTFGTLLNYFYEPVQNLINLESDIRELDLVLNRMTQLDIKNSNNGITNELCSGDIKISNLSYTYDDRKKILSNINLNIKSGEKIIVLGKSGSGKSTLAKILMKYYEIDRGKIFINNIDIVDYLSSNGISYISQSENLFNASLYDNITLYENVKFNSVLDICDICELSDIISKSQLGFNFLVEENGANFSGGERQRIVLARTLIRKFNILIIDEGLNQIDSNLERRIIKKIFNKFKNKTIIIISHRLDNLDLYDRKIILENGEIVDDTSKSK